jgi:CspA family cold shock protein
VAAVARGEIVRFDQVKGYGFISPHGGGEDVFLHVNDLLDDKHLMQPGATVDFEVESGDRGLKASGVHVVSPAPGRAFAPGLAGAQGPAVAVRMASVDSEDDLVDVLSEADLSAEVTEVLLRVDPPLTGQQILAVRKALLTMGDRYGWIGD